LHIDRTCGVARPFPTSSWALPVVRATTAFKILNPIVAGGHSLKYAPVAARFKPDSAQTGAERYASERIGLLKETQIPQSNREPSTAETGEQVPVRPHDSGSGANETVDGLDATTEALRHAAEDTPSGAKPDDAEKVPVFDRAGQAPKI
jgi:hypothetical protein